MNVNLGDKITLSALHLVMFVDEVICDAVMAANERSIDTTEFARDKVVELFRKEAANG